MRFAVVGTGAVGAEIARTLALQSSVDSVMLCDIDIDNARRIADELAPARAPVSARKVDITNGAELRAALAEVEVVVCAVGPFYRFGPAVLEAALDTGTHYVDICDDWETTEQLLAFDERARSVGVCAVTGAGASPGLSTLLAAHAAARLDRVSSIYTAWPVDITDDASASTTPLDGAAGVHWMHQSSGLVAEVSDGAIIYRPPLRPVVLQLPDGSSGTGYTIGHPEPMTLRDTVFPCGEAACLMLLRPATARYLDVLRRDMDRGRLTSQEAAGLLDRPSLSRVLRSCLGRRRWNGAGSLPQFFAAADGLRLGSAHRVSVHLEYDYLGELFGSMAVSTGVPAALIAVQLATGDLPWGLYPPDRVVDRERLFADLALVFPGMKLVIKEGPGCLTD
ncbi:saccharopine dehydrogenase NADP-binding domain-containing protein [Mycolicibacterium sp. A43C]